MPLLLQSLSDLSHEEAVAALKKILPRLDTYELDETQAQAVGVLMEVVA